LEVNYKRCLDNWQDYVTNVLTDKGIYDKVPFQSRGHSLKVKDEYNIQRLKLCVNNMTEEYQELIEELDAMFLSESEIKPEKVMKELCDVLYVVFGFASRFKELKYVDEAFIRVHNNNMQKLEKGTVRSDGKIVKPKGHLPPDLSDLIEKGVNDG
jgi:hypothetical protein|tara:strand:- start:4311 stop:4775 length:465 start_codon:yes stop_codon:yes gene_type:complete